MHLMRMHIFSHCYIESSKRTSGGIRRTGTVLWCLQSEITQSV
uniref:Uncharacterized protein n=1 Tax=Anguilla anguilla TaxID=7936 RepID=A0A0E9RZH5_ANGAN